MPYIKVEDRERYKHTLRDLIEKLPTENEEELGGHLNYCITVLLRDLFAERRRYVRINTLRGAIENAWTEFARREVTPYEDEKVDENGDVYGSPTASFNSAEKV